MALSDMLRYLRQPNRNIRYAQNDQPMDQDYNLEWDFPEPGPNQDNITGFLDDIKHYDQNDPGTPYSPGWFQGPEWLMQYLDPQGYEIRRMRRDRR